MIDLMRPIITSNGTGIDGLVYQRIAATEALRGATEALRYMAPKWARLYRLSRTIRDR